MFVCFEGHFGFARYHRAISNLKRSIVVRGHKTSVSLEDDFWNALKEIASARKITATELISEVDSNRKPGNLSSTLRVMVLAHYRQTPDPTRLMENHR